MGSLRRRSHGGRVPQGLAERRGAVTACCGGWWQPWLATNQCRLLARTFRICRRRGLVAALAASSYAPISGLGIWPSGSGPVRRSFDLIRGLGLRRGAPAASSLRLPPALAESRSRDAKLGYCRREILAAADPPVSSESFSEPGGACAAALRGQPERSLSGPEPARSRPERPRPPQVHRRRLHRAAR